MEEEVRLGLGVETAVGFGVAVVDPVGTGAVVGGSTGVGAHASRMPTTAGIHDRGNGDTRTDPA
jgi:hypothetical protein